MAQSYVVTLRLGVSLPDPLSEPNAHAETLSFLRAMKAQEWTVPLPPCAAIEEVKIAGPYGYRKRRPDANATASAPSNGAGEPASTGPASSSG